MVNHLCSLSEKLDIYSSSFNNFIILGDFNVEMEEQQNRVFCDNNSFKNVIRQSTCYKRPSNPICIDLILVTTPQNLKALVVLETGLSNFHLITVTVMRKIFRKLKPRILYYRSHKHFSNEPDRESLLHELSKEVFVNTDDCTQRFCDIDINI